MFLCTFRKLQLEVKIKSSRLQFDILIIDNLITQKIQLD